MKALDKLLNEIKETVKTSAPLIDLINSCQEYLDELEENEYQAHRARHLSNISYILG